MKKLVFCFSSLDILGLAPRFRAALETNRVEVEEWTALAMIQGLHAAFFNLPEVPFQIPVGSDLMNTGNFWKKTVSPFTGEPIALARRLDVDTVLFHAQRADRQGNIEIQGARGLDLSLLGASKKNLFTVEEIVEVGELGSAPKSYVLPRTFVSAIAQVPGGAYPTSCLPYYTTDYRRLVDYVRTEEQSKKSAAAPLPPHRSEAPTASSPRFVFSPAPPNNFSPLRPKSRCKPSLHARLERFGLKIEPAAPYTLMNSSPSLSRMNTTTPASVRSARFRRWPWFRICSPSALTRPASF